MVRCISGYCPLFNKDNSNLVLGLMFTMLLLLYWYCVMKCSVELRLDN